MAETPSALGAFHVRWIIGNPTAGGQMLHVDAVVVTPSRSVSGVARLTQAISPPLDVHFDIHGPYMDVTEKHFVLLSTNPAGPPGTPFLFLGMVLNADWKSGTASYRYVIGSTTGHQENVPVKIEAMAATTA